jgi:hypothetical protein
MNSLIGVPYPVILLDRCEYELGKIRWVYEHTTIKQFLFLQDSCIVKDFGWIDALFSHDKSVSLSHHQYFMYLGKYTRTDLAKVDMPVVSSKKEAVEQESQWTGRYAAAAQSDSLWPLFDTNVFEERHGRTNMVLENDHIIKYKGHWNPEMIKD